MAHNRTEIRNAVVTLLGGMTTPTAVYSERRHRIDASLRPLVIVSTGETTAEAGETAMGHPSYTVESLQTVTLELHAEGAAGDVAAATIDQMELEAEALLASDLTLGGLVEMIYPAGSDLEMSADQDRVIAVRTVNYAVPWRHTFGAPDTPES